MVYTIIVEGRSYDLPKKTLTVMQSMEDVFKADNNDSLSISQKYKKVHNFVKSIIGDESSKEIFGTDDINDMDLSELTLTLKKIKDAYEKPIKEYEHNLQWGELEKVPLDKIVELANAAKSIPNLKNNA